MFITYHYIRIIGYIAITYGSVNTILYYHGRLLHLSEGYNLGIGFGTEAIILIGVVALLVAQCLKNFDTRLVKLEGNPSAYNAGPGGNGFVQFDVPQSAIGASDDTVAKIYVPNSIVGPAKNITEMPPVANIVGPK